MAYIIRIFLLIFLAFPLIGEAQQVLSFNYTTVEGLPNNAIHALLVDSRGILWVGTENGVSKFENGSFQNFYDSDGLGFSSCWAIAEDKNGNMWFGSYGGGISIFDGKKFQAFTTDDGLADNRIRHLYPYGERMLIGTEDGLSIADIATQKIHTITGSVRQNDLNYTTGFFEYNDALYYSTYRSGSYEVILGESDSKVRKVNDWLPIYSMTMQRDSLLLADKGRLQKLSISDFIQGQAPSLAFGQSIVWKNISGLKGETYFVAASTFTKNGGVFLLDKNQMRDQNSRFGITSRFILAAALDKNRNLLYLGSQDKGLFQVRLDEVYIYESFEEAEVKSIAGSEGLLGLLSTQGLEIRDAIRGKVRVKPSDFDRLQKEFYRKFPSKIPNHLDGFFELDPTITAEDIEFYQLHFRDNSFWTNTNIGIFELDRNGAILHYLPVHAFSIGFTPDGKLMETNPYAGVRIYSDPRNFVYTYFEPTDPSTPLQIAQLVEDKNRTYLASVFHGLYHWDGREYFSYKNEGIWTESKFKTLHSLGGGKLLAGTEFGDLYLLETQPTFQIIKKWPKDQLQGNSILFIESYQDAFLIGTELGLHVLRGDEIRFWEERKGAFQRVFKSAKRIGDKLFIGLDKGFYTVNLPDLLAQKNSEIDLLITDIKVNSKAIDENLFNWFAYQGESLKLTANENSLSIRFKPIGNVSGGRLRYHYRIKPNAAWTEFNDESAIELPFLPFGKYQLEVQVLDYFSGQTTTVSLLEFWIERPYYLKWWFIVLLILAFSGLFLWIYKVRTRQLKNRSQLKQRLTELKLEALQSQMNPHFIFNAINSIQYYILKKDTPQALEYLAKFSKLIRSTLDQSSKSKVSLEEEVSYLKSYIEVENIRMDNRVTWEITGSALERKQTLHIPPMIIQPLVENVFNHAFAVDHPNPELSISYELLAENQVLCIVKDNGTGIQQADKIHESKGIKMIREKLSLLPGYTSESLVVNTSNQGYEVRVKIFCS